MRKRKILLIAWMFVMAGALYGSANASPAAGTDSLNYSQRNQMDSVELAPLLISAQTTGGFTSASTTADSFWLRQFSAFDLPTALLSLGVANVRSYGPGQGASIGIRGLDSRHTLVLWNGVSLNSNTLGGFDLAAFSVDMVSSLSIIQGSASLSNSSGGLGGALLMGSPNASSFENGVNLRLNTGSFHSSDIYLRAVYGKTFKGSTSFSHQYSKNNYDIEEAGITKQLSGASANHTQFEQQLEWRLSAVHSLRLVANYHLADIGIPAALYVSDQSESRDDENFKGLLENKVNLNYGVLTAQITWLKDFMQYDNEVADIHQNFQNQAVDGQLRFSSRQLSAIRWRGGVNFRFDNAKSAALTSLQKRQTYAIWGETSWRISEKTQVEAMMRQEFANDWFVFLPHLKLSHMLLPSGTSHQVILRLGGGRNAQRPSFNDLYWQPGGNPDLLPESSFDLEWEAKWKYRTSAFDFTAASTLFYRAVRHKIQWQPSDAGYWQAFNTDKVHSQGAELKAIVKYSNGKSNSKKMDATLRLNYQYVQFEPVGEHDEVVIYQPAHLFSSLANLTISSWQYFIWQTLNGSRYTTTDASSSLPAYMLTGSGIKYLLTKGVFDFEFGLTIENIFDVKYESVVNRPMPGRSYKISAAILFNPEK